MWGDAPDWFNVGHSPVSMRRSDISLLNIDLPSMVPEQQVQTSNIISTDKYNPFPTLSEYTLNTYITLKCYIWNTRTTDLDTTCEHNLKEDMCGWNWFWAMLLIYAICSCMWAPPLTIICVKAVLHIYDP